MDLSIVIPAWNGEKVIKKCLASIYRAKLDFKLEVIVVDNYSKDKTREIIEKDFKQVKLIKNKKNLGYAKANNIGIKKAKGKYILLLNQDIEFRENAIQKMYNFLENPKNKKRKIAVVAPKLVYPDGSVQNSLRKFPTPLNIVVDALTFGKWHQTRYNLDKSQIVDQPMASCLMIKGDVLRKLKGFDTNQNFFLFFNDVDLSYRIFQSGYFHYYLAEVKVIHHHGFSTNMWPSFKKIYVWSRGLYYFLVKHYARINFALKPIIFLEVLLIFIVRIIADSLKSLLKLILNKNKKLII
jgi:hypothetical protein